MNADTGTVSRVLRILSCFAEKDEWGLNELARALGLPRASAHRLLNLCKPLDYVSQNERGHYVPGLELYRLAGKLSSVMPMHRLALPILQEVRDRTDETALLALLVRRELRMFFSLSASPSHPLRYTVEHNRLEPLDWGAAARVILAHLSEEEIATVVERADPSPQDARPQDKAELLQSLAGIRETGHAVTFAQRSPDSWGIAAPFFDAHDAVAGSINITVPSFRMEQHRRADLVKLVMDACARLTRQLGGTARGAAPA